MSVTLPELIDVRGIQEEMGVKRTIAERIIEQIPKQEIPGVRRLLVRRSEVPRRQPQIVMADERESLLAAMRSEIEMGSAYWDLLMEKDNLVKLLDAVEMLARAAYVAERLHGMIDRETWRATGAEWMGQYEGDYHAEQVQHEIDSWKETACL